MLLLPVLEGVKLVVSGLKHGVELLLMGGSTVVLDQRELEAKIQTMLLEKFFRKFF